MYGATGYEKKRRHRDVNSDSDGRGHSSRKREQVSLKDAIGEEIPIILANRERILGETSWWILGLESPTKMLSTFDVMAKLTPYVDHLLVGAQP